MDKIIYYRARRLIRKFSERYHRNRMDVMENEVIDFYNDLSRYIAYFFNRDQENCIDYLIKIGNLLIDETRDVNIDFVFIIPLIHLEVLYIILEEEEYSDVVNKYYKIVGREEGIYFLIDNTIGILEKSSLEDAVASSSGMLLLGIDSYFRRDPDATLKVIGYYVLLSDILSRDNEEKYIFSLISYFSLSLYLDIILYDREFVWSLNKYGDRVFSSSFITNLIKSSKSELNLSSHLDKKFGDFIRFVLDSNEDKMLMKESLALRWYLYRVRENSRYRPLIDNALRVLSASMRVLRKGGYDDVMKAEEIYKKKWEEGSLSDDEKDLLAIAALELYKAGLKSSYENIVNFLHSVGDRSRDSSIHDLAEILKNIRDKEKDF